MFYTRGNKLVVRLYNSNADYLIKALYRSKNNVENSIRIRLEHLVDILPIGANSVIAEWKELALKEVDSLFIANRYLPIDQISGVKTNNRKLEIALDNSELGELLDFCNDIYQLIINNQVSALDLIKNTLVNHNALKMFIVYTNKNKINTYLSMVV